MNPNERDCAEAFAAEAAALAVSLYKAQGDRPPTLTAWGLEVAVKAGEVAQATARNRRGPAHALLQTALLRLAAACLGAIVHLTTRTLR